MLGKESHQSISNVWKDTYARKRYRRKSTLELDVTFGLLQLIAFERFHHNVRVDELLRWLCKRKMNA